MKVRDFILGFLMLNYVSFFSQNSSKTRQEFAKIKEAYAQHKSMSFDVEVMGYEKPTDKTPEIIGKGTTKKGNGFKYSKFDDVECIQNKNNTLYIDHSYKTMSYYDNINIKAAKKVAPKPVDISSAMDSMWKKYDSLMIYKGIESNMKHFVLFHQTDQIKQSDLYFNTNTNLLEKVIYYYNPSNEKYETEYSSVIIYYRNYNFSTPSSETFNLNKFISKDSKGFKPTLAYKGYEVQYYDLSKKSSKN